MTTTPRRGSPWSQFEILTLITSIQEGKSIQDIANYHGRTVFAIKAYLKKLAGNFYFLENIPFEHVQRMTRLTNYEMEEALAEQRHKIQMSVRR
jgi:hypothetical protein